MPSFKGKVPIIVIKEKEGLPFAGVGLEKQKRMIIFLSEIGSRKKGVMGYGMGTYTVETL
jgi:hypothetical protein